MKLIDIGERKMVEAILFLSGRVKYPFLLKMLKLLYYLDFLHFKATGRAVTNQKYIAMEMGPVPVRLYSCIKNNACSDYFNNRVKIVVRPDFYAYEFKRKKQPDLTVFSPREMDILKDISTVFRDARASVMTESTHLKNSPWEKTVREKGFNHGIDFFLALDDEAPIPTELAEERYRDHEIMTSVFG
jgi:uncharacterized phage-associated protein